MSQTLPQGARILDLGTPNELSKYLKTKGYQVINTMGEDLDLNPEILSSYQTDAVTGFEILEHLVNPYGVLKNINANRLYITVPLSLWFSSAYRNKNNLWDQHFHEFEDWQLDFLVEKAGWKITRRKKWKSPSFIPGIRPILRYFTYRYYAIEATRN